MSGYQMYRPTSRASYVVYEEFNQLLDMIWKLPSFLSLQRDAEQKKLEEYFPDGAPDSAKLRALRAVFEGSKLDVEFPRYLSQTGVLLSVALYEARFVQSVNSMCQPTKAADGLAASWDVLERHGFSKTNYVSRSRLRLPFK